MSSLPALRLLSSKYNYFTYMLVVIFHILCLIILEMYLVRLMSRYSLIKVNLLDDRVVVDSATLTN